MEISNVFAGVLVVLIIDSVHGQVANSLQVSLMIVIYLKDDRFLWNGGSLEKKEGEVSIDISIFEN